MENVTKVRAGRRNIVRSFMHVYFVYSVLWVVDVVEVALVYGSGGGGGIMCSVLHPCLFPTVLSLSRQHFHFFLVARYYHSIAALFAA